MQVLRTYKEGRERRGGAKRTGVFIIALVFALVLAGAQAGTVREAIASSLSGETGAESKIALDFSPADFAVLSREDAALYERIFTLQEAGDLKAAAELLTQVRDPILLGHTTEQKLMHPTAYRSPYNELKDWLAQYGDHPGAWRVYKLARRRQSGGEASPKVPSEVLPTRFVLAELEQERTPQEDKSRSYGGRFVSSPDVVRGHDRQARKIIARVRQNVRRERLTVTERSLRGEWRGHLSEEEYYEGLARVAAGWLRWGDVERALALAEEGAVGGGAWYPLAYWTAGLSAWLLGDMGRSWDYFSALSVSALASADVRAKGAWWSARAALRLRRPEEVSDMLRRAAAEEGAHLYGFLAREALGVEVVRGEWGSFLYGADSVAGGADGANGEGEGETGRFLLALEGLPTDSMETLAVRIHRALALIQVGQVGRAEAELLQLGDLSSEAEVGLVLALADIARLPRLSLRAASDLLEGTTDKESRRAELLSALYPVPPWVPSTGFSLDRAFLYAVMREESRFNPRAVSRDGARGVMQLLPSTAAFVTGERSLRASSGRGRLYEPRLNFTIGQRYLEYLLEDEAVGGEVIRILAAYNGGPGNLRKWSAWLSGRGVESARDPILYLEMLPAAETRRYAAKVMVSFWYYRSRLGQESLSLSELAAGRTPLYVPQDESLAR